MENYFDNSWIHARFQYRVKKLGNGCIEWLGAKSKLGYGHIAINSKTKYCHRVLYEITHKVILRRDQFVCHSCDSPSCVNIDHLWLGSAYNNTQDMIKGRYNNREKCVPSVVKKPRKTTKLHTRQRIVSDETIRSIRQAAGKHKWVAEEHGVSIGYVSKIKNMKAKTLV